MSEIVRVQDNTLVLTEEVKAQIKSIMEQKKVIEKAEKEMKESILKAMEDNNVIKYEADDMLITYVQGTYKEQLDSKKLKAEQEELYNEYTKFVKVSPSVRITLRG